MTTQPSARPHPLALRQSRLALLVVGLLALALLTAMPANAGGGPSSPTPTPTRTIAPFYEVGLARATRSEFARALREAPSYKTQSVFLIRPSGPGTVSFYTANPLLGPLQEEATLVSFPEGMICTTRIDGCRCETAYTRFLVFEEDDLPRRRPFIQRIVWMNHINPDSVG